MKVFKVVVKGVGRNGRETRTFIVAASDESAACSSAQTSAAYFCLWGGASAKEV
jgi:hypothetical protein